MGKRTKGLLSLLFCGLLNAQVDIGFSDYLLRHNLSLEHLAYINTLPREIDSTHFLYSKHYQQYFQDSLLLLHYNKSRDLCLSDQRFINQASRNFLRTSRETQRENWFSLLAGHPVDESTEWLKTIYLASEHPQRLSPDSLQEELRPVFIQYRKACRKHPALASALSAIIPGTGKWYAGNTKSFLFSLSLCTAYAFQTVESARKLGPDHPFTFVNAGAFALFYFSGIYGSYKAVLIKRKEYKKQFIIEATELYN